MILQGNQRGGAKDLANHLMKSENEKVEIHSIRGFASDNLYDAFNEAYAISRGTRCKQFLYSLSINPPHEADIQDKDIENAANEVEHRLGLSGQPRIIVFHEKRGRDGKLRRHAHAVWSRINAVHMKAIHLPFTKHKLRKISRDLHIQHNLKMPAGLLNYRDRNPANFTLEQWQQCKRAKKDIDDIQSIFRDCWQLSDSRSSFASALQENGYCLAKGRRGFVAVDYQGEKYAISRYIGIRTKQVREKLGEPDKLPTVEQAHWLAVKQVTDRLGQLTSQERSKLNTKRQNAQAKQKRMKAVHAKQSTELKNQHLKRRTLEEEIRQLRFRKGIFSVWDWLTGERKKTVEMNAKEKLHYRKRDREEAKSLRNQQLEAIKEHAEKLKETRINHYAAIKELQQDIERLQDLPDKIAEEEREKQKESTKTERPRRRNRSRDGPDYS